MTEKRKERRLRKRVIFETQVMVKSSDGTKSFEGTSRNIGMGGIYIEADDLFEPETACEVEIILTAKHSKIVLHIDGQVTRKDGKGMAIMFGNDMEWWALFAIYGQYGNPSAKLYSA